MRDPQAQADPGRFFRQEARPTRALKADRGPSCEKCGSDDVLVRWHGEREHRAACAPMPFQPTSKKEHLHYHCRRCQFDWIGPVLGGKL